MTDDREKNSQLVKAKTSSLQKRASNIVSSGLSDLALLDVDNVKRIMDETGVSCCIDHFGSDAPEVFSEGTTIYINRDHPVYKRESANVDTHKLNVTRLINREISLLHQAREWSKKGFNYSRKEEYDKAIEAYTNAIALNLNYASYNNRGTAYGNKGQYDRAIEDFNKALALEPNYADAYYSRGVAYDNKGQYARAIEDYNKALALEPNYAKAYNNRGLVYEMKGNFDKAISDFKKACDLGNEKGCENLQRLLRQK